MRIYRTDTRSTLAERGDAWVRTVLDGLAPFPALVETCGPELPDVLHRYFAHHAESRLGPNDPSEVADVIEQAGLRIDRQVSGAELPWENMPDGADRTRQPYVFVVERG